MGHSFTLKQNETADKMPVNYLELAAHEHWKQYTLEYFI